MVNQTTPKGFSLIELLLVITMIGIISVIAVPSLLKSKESAEKTAVIGVLRTIQSHQMIYMAHNERYARLDELNAQFNNTLGTTVNEQIVRGNYRFIMSPQPTNQTLKTQYRIIAYKKVDRFFVPAFSTSQTGVIETIIP